jgi:hypothetical protein
MRLRLKLPRFRSVERLALQSGDCLVIRVNQDSVTDRDADILGQKIRAVLGIPHLPVVVLSRHSSIQVLAADALLIPKPTLDRKSYIDPALAVPPTRRPVQDAPQA